MPTSVAAIRFWRSLWARDTLSSLLFNSLLTVCSSSLIDCSSSLLVSSSSAVERYSSLIDCNSSLAARNSSFAPSYSSREARSCDRLNCNSCRSCRICSSAPVLSFVEAAPPRQRLAFEEEDNCRAAGAGLGLLGLACRKTRRAAPLKRTPIGPLRLPSLCANTR